MLTAHQLAKSFQLTTLFEDVTFSVNAGDRLGLIGPNGCGKTTLMRILAGQESADSGHITHDPTLRIGYLPQGFELPPTLTVHDAIGRAADDVNALENELAELAVALSQTPADTDLHTRYDRLLQRISRAEPARAASVLAALGLDDVPPDLLVRHLSGGQKTRLNLALVLLDDPELLLLDEPTNHLDIGMLQWLETWLGDFPGGVLLISHDRTFLDHSATAILEIDPLTQAARQYAGNYSAYLAQRMSEREKQLAAYRDQVYEIRRMKQDIQRERQRAMKIHTSTTARQPSLRKKAKRAMQRAKSREKKLDRYVEADERVEKPGRSWGMKLDFADSERLGRLVLQTDRLVVGYDSAEPLLSDVTLTIQAGERIVMTGPNGAGKTTLLRTIVGALPPLDGALRIGSSVQLGYMSQEQARLDETHSPLQSVQGVASLNETDARTFLHYFLFTGDEALKPNAQLSFGQRARLQLALLVAQGCNFLVLDEPINHLDIPSRTLFEQALQQFDGTTLAVVHDRYFIERFATAVWWVENGAVRLEHKVVDA